MTLPDYRKIGKMTIAQAVDLVRHSLHEQDNARLHDLTLRMYLNSSKIELAELLMASNEPYYSYGFFAQTDEVDEYEEYNALNSANALDGRINVRVIDLTQEVEGKYPVDILHTIKEVHLIGHGIAVNMPHQAFFTAANDQSFIGRESIFWTLHSDRIYIAQGIHAVDVDDVEDLDEDRHSNARYEILGYRYPSNDDFLMPDSSTEYRGSIDVPPKMYRTLIMMAQKLSLESLGKSLVPEAEQMLANAISTLTQAKEASIAKGQANE